jgi:hypothetical protein
MAQVSPELDRVFEGFAGSKSAKCCVISPHKASPCANVDEVGVDVETTVDDVDGAATLLCDGGVACPHAASANAKTPITILDIVSLPSTLVQGVLN